MHSRELIIYRLVRIIPPNNFVATILESRQIGKYYNNFTLNLHNIVFIITNEQYNIMQLRSMFFSRSRSVAVVIMYNLLTVTGVMYTNNHYWILLNIFTFCMIFDKKKKKHL